jgi:hypothetical protein
MAAAQKLLAMLGMAGTVLLAGCGGGSSTPAGSFTSGASTVATVNFYPNAPCAPPAAMPLRD